MSFTRPHARTLAQVPGPPNPTSSWPESTAARTSMTEPIVGSFADALALRVPCRHPSISTSIQATHQALYDGLANQAPYSLLWREPSELAELMELNQVILNLEQTIAIQDDGAPLGSTFNVEPIADESEGQATRRCAQCFPSMHPLTELRDNGSGPASLPTRRPGNAALSTSFKL